MEEIVIGTPAICAGNSFNFGPSLANYYFSLVPIYVKIPLYNFTEKELMYLMLDWFLVMKEHIAQLRSIVVPKVVEIFYVGMTKRITEPHAIRRAMLLNPGPKHCVINFIDTDHV